MQDIMNIVKNIDSIYNSNTSFNILKDFERVLDELDLYVYKNWKDGEVCAGPKIDRHWVTCSFMWDRANMPDPMGGKRLLDYDCKVSYAKDYVIEPRKIKVPGDIRPGSKKGKLDRRDIWVVTIQMPKKLIIDIYGGSFSTEEFQTEPAVAPDIAPEPQVADTMAPTDTTVAPAPEGEVV
ncbi:MAG: hypothetical protein ACKVJK_11325 [Methylophagaceae bacterium]|jgi:hypothetical protein|tara:strand:+ start:1696 stop:2235 length:540 start_codon:yes stop_codon:yes gene_type:complete